MFIADITVSRHSLGPAGPDSTLERLLAWFDLPREETLERLAQQQERRPGRLVLVANADMPQVAAVEERGRQLPDVRVEARARRRYAYNGPLFAHVVGYVGEVGQADLDTTGGIMGYRLGDMIGQAGGGGGLGGAPCAAGTASSWRRSTPPGASSAASRSGWWTWSPGPTCTLSLSLPLQAKLAEVLGDRAACAVAILRAHGRGAGGGLATLLRSQPADGSASRPRSGGAWPMTRPSRSSTASCRPPIRPARSTSR